jgi:hypothetical protein
MVSHLLTPILAALVATAPVAAPERTVEKNSVVSRVDPAATVRVPRSAVYVGGDRWPLYDVADCEVHVFVEADAQKRVKRYYWIQFEQYLPTRPDAIYDYSSAVNVRQTIWGKTWWRRARFGSTSETPQAGSDLERVYGLITKAGYTLPADIINVRMVRFLDDPNDSGKGRKELLLFYAEDMADVGATTNDFITDNKVNAKWAPVEKALVERAIKRFGVRWSRPVE